MEAARSSGSAPAGLPPRSRRWYRWWYDHVQSVYYDALMVWCFLPFGGERRFRLELLEAVGFVPGERILEMCSGTGNATHAIARRAGPESTIVGVDLSVGQLRRAHRKVYAVPVTFAVMDAARTGFPDSTFDKVFIPHAVHEMPRALRMAVLREAHRVLRPRGTLVVLELDRPASVFCRVFVGFWFFYWLPFNFETPTRRDMLEHGVENEVRAAGFSGVTKRSLHAGAFQVVQGTATDVGRA